MKAADGTTDLYGMMFRPTNFDPSKKYPIINNAYPGPQSGSVGSRAFTAARGDKQALAELGFIVVSSTDAERRAGRSRSTMRTTARWAATTRSPIRSPAMKDLAKQYPWIDIDKAAMWGHSGGGFITADAHVPLPRLLQGRHRRIGQSRPARVRRRLGRALSGFAHAATPTAPTATTSRRTRSQAKNLKGHLLLAHGTMDNNVPPYNTLLVADALIKANKDFDLLMLPNQPHGYGNMSNYMMRRRWDYFVKYLLGAEPPKEYDIKAP